MKKTNLKAIIALAPTFAINTALAAGGLSSVSSGLETLKTILYAIAGGVAICVVIWAILAVKVFNKQWSEVIQVGIWAIILGASPAIAVMLWDFGKSML